MSMSEDECVVRGAWETESTALQLAFDTGSWSAARKFTDEHREKIRQVREEVAEIVSLMVSSIVRVNPPVMRRLLSERKSCLDALLKGWKE